MSYYYFNRCESSCIRGIEKIAKDLGLIDYSDTLTSGRHWSGSVLNGRNKFDRELIMTYLPGDRLPLCVQTNVQKHKKKQVRKIIKSLIELCKPTEIYQEPIGIIKYNLKDFED